MPYPFKDSERYPGELASCAISEKRSVFDTEISPVTGEKTVDLEYNPSCKIKNKNFNCKDYEAEDENNL